jgi:alpha-beta hydrolase superfamily lysophospholipase
VDHVVSKRVSFPGGSSGLTLEGILSFPESFNACDYPAVIIVHGSGPVGRDGTVPGQLNMLYNRPVATYRDLALGLARKGFVVLRYDKRTCYSENGCDNQYPKPDERKLSYWDFEADVEAAIQFLNKQKNVRADDIILIGHSQGGQVVPFAAEGNPAVTDLVLLAAPYRPIDQILAYQARVSRNLIEMQLGMRAGEAPDDLIIGPNVNSWFVQAINNLISKVIVKLGFGEKVVETALKPLNEMVTQLAFLREGKFEGETIGGPSSAFWKEWLDAGDRTPETLAKFHGGVLVLKGTADSNVAHAEMVGWMEYFSKRPDSEVKELNGLTHSFNKMTGTGFYEHVDASCIDAIASWLLRMRPVSAQIPHDVNPNLPD